MRWFVEVASIGGNANAEKYCVEAKQWQAALQEARKLRGDSGPLSKFSIELLDEGYRAVDPAMQVRYVVNRAPGDAPLTGRRTNGQAAEPPPKTEPMNAPPTQPQSASPSGATDAVAPTRKASVPQIRVPVDEVPPPPPRPAASEPPSSTGHSLSKHPTQKSLKVPTLPDFDLVKKREEEPKPGSPITYREYAYVVKPGTEIEAAEVLLWSKFRDVSQALSTHPAGKFIQLAVFDHAFDNKPKRPPLATLAWKDWRGEPVVQYPARDGKAPASVSHPPAPSQSAPPASSQSAPPAKPALASTAPAAPPADIAKPSAPPAKSSAAPAAGKPASPATSVKPAPEKRSPAAVPPPKPSGASFPAPPKPIAEVPANSAPAASVPAAPAPAASAPAASAPATAAEPAVPAAAPTASPAGAAPNSAAESAPSAPVSAPAAAPASEEASQPKRHKASEDLIGELFETMHDLHFMQNTVGGAEFVMGVLRKTIPCEGALIHVFDINTRNFVIVRADGPNAKTVLMHRTPDSDGFVAGILRRPRALRVDAASDVPEFNGGRWEALGVKVETAVCGPVRQGGRYLGLIELVNAPGAPFYESEANALDYICEQFAEFLAQRPVVVDAEVVLQGA